eukprot:1738570-Pleurochrysis_carterae.AAC.1
MYAVLAMQATTTAAAIAPAIADSSQPIDAEYVAICNDVSNSLTLLGVYSVALSRKCTQSCAHA